MELNLNAVDYQQVSVTDKKCMHVLPNLENSSGPQKVVVGDKSGILQSFGIKKQEVNTIFKSLPGAAINRIALGGVLGGTQDKIFVTSNAEVRAFSRKGKKFLDFNTNLTESVSNLCVSGSDLLVSGSYIYNHFHDCNDQGYYLSNDSINDMLCLPATNRGETQDFTPVLACNDKVLRVLKGCALFYEVELPGSPSCMTEYIPNEDLSTDFQVVYGTMDGKIGHVLLNEHQPVYKWEIPNSKNLGGISCLSHYDVTGDGMNDLLVGREDGTVEVYSYDVMDQPQLRFTHSYKESVTSICGGVVGNVGFDEVLTCTYSGWISALTTEHQTKTVTMEMMNAKQQGSTSGGASGSGLMIDGDTEKKLLSLRDEVEALELQVESEREKHMQRTAKSLQQKNDVVTIAPEFHVNDRFILTPSDASYHLSIEVQTTIDHVVIQSNVPVDLLDLDTTTALVSYTRLDEKPNKNNAENFLLATYRCQADTSRLEIKIRSIEGHTGAIQAYIVPRLKPKTSVVRSYPIKALSLHQRCHSIDTERPMNTLRLTGAFSIAEIHSWLSASLPDLAERTPTTDTVTLYFVNTFLDTQLECAYKKAEARFRSDNISTISILKDFMTKEATAKKIALKINYDVTDDSIHHTLHLLHPKLDKQLLLAKKMQLLPALQDLATHEGNTAFLAPEYQDILKNADELREQHKKQPARLERLYGMITDLYIDKFKFKGVNVKARVPQLLRTLDNYDINALLEFFQQEAY